jgi:hypothetical protein
MKNRANPIPSGTAGTQSGEDRKVMCADYRCCLDVAVDHNWQGFSCRKCCAFKPLQFDSGELLLDTLACVALINVAESQNSFKKKPRGSIVRRLQHMMSRGSVMGSE